MGPQWLQAIAYCFTLHWLLWDHSASYKAFWASVRVWIADHQPRPQIRLYGRLRADVEEALSNG